MFSYIDEIPLVSTGIIHNMNSENRPVIYKTDENHIFIETNTYNSLKVITVNGEVKESININQESYLLNLNNYDKGVYIIVLESLNNRYAHKFIR